MGRFHGKMNFDMLEKQEIVSKLFFRFFVDISTVCGSFVDLTSGCNAAHNIYDIKPSPKNLDI